jgi:hypothetical protein
MYPGEFRCPWGLQMMTLGDAKVVDANVAEAGFEEDEVDRQT